MKNYLLIFRRRIFILLAVFGPATITAMADNDASGVATYSIAGATLGYPILLVLLLTTILLGITQEMGIRLAIISRKGLGDLIREHYGIKASIFIFVCLLVANMGTIIVNLAAVKTTSSMLSLPAIPITISVIAFSFLFVTKGNYKTNQNIFLISTLFYITYIFSAVKSNPDWNMALTNLIWPHGITFSKDYWIQYLIISLGVLGTTVTPWGQFFISSFAYDKNIDTARLKYSQLETYWGAFLTDLFSFFMIVATAAILFTRNIPVTSGEQAALAIKPFAGELAGMIFAIGIFNAGFMGIVIVSLSTAYAFSEFFGFSGSLDASFHRSKNFYLIFLIQLLVAFFIILLPQISLFRITIATQILNATMLPFIFYYLIKLTNNRQIMGANKNNSFQYYFATIATIIIIVASVINLIIYFF